MYQNPAGWNVTSVGATGAAVAVTRSPPALPQNVHIAGGVDVSFSAAPSAPVLGQLLDWSATVPSIPSSPSVASQASTSSGPSVPSNGATVASVASTTSPALWEAYVPVLGASYNFRDGISAKQGGALVFTLSAPGGTVIGRVELRGTTTK